MYIFQLLNYSSISFKVPNNNNSHHCLVGRTNQKGACVVIAVVQDYVYM